MKTSSVLKSSLHPRELFSGFSTLRTIMETHIATCAQTYTDTQLVGGYAAAK